MTITTGDGFSILHISDLHFGAHDADKTTALQAYVREHKPDVICITGDIAEAPKTDFFLRAKDYIQGLAQFCEDRVFCIPGNHDAFLRGISLRKFRATLGKELEYGFHLRVHNRDVCIFGIDTTAFSFSHLNNSGRFSDSSRRALLKNIDLLRKRLGGNSFDRAIKIVLVHHHPLPTVKSKLDEMLYFKHSGKFLALMAQHRIDFVLPGHQHDPHYYKIDYNLGSDSDSLIVLSAGTATKDTTNDLSDDEGKEKYLCNTTQFYHIQVVGQDLDIEEYKYYYPTKEFLNSRRISTRKTVARYALRKDYSRYRMCKNGDMEVWETRTMAAPPSTNITTVPISIGVDDETPECDDFQLLGFTVSREGRELSKEMYSITQETGRQKRIVLNLDALPITTTPVEVSWSYKWPGGFQRLLENGADTGTVSLSANLDEMKIDVETEFHQISSFEVICREMTRVRVLEHELQRYSFQITRPASTEIVYFRISVTNP
jgi:predicted MPP superfamily phosphohydrolase